MSPHDEQDDYADGPTPELGAIDRLFIGILPIHLIFLVLIPVWWALAPASVGWAGLGLLVCRHPLARRNAILLFVVGAGQLTVMVLVAIWLSQFDVG